MGLNKPSGNMYSWAFTWNPIGGQCRYDCDYCFVREKIAVWLARMGNQKYLGEPRLFEKEFKVKLVVPKGFVVFVQSCGDLFGYWIPDAWIKKVLDRVKEFPQTKFLLQTKNPKRFLDFQIPCNCILGTTIETNRHYPISFAPTPTERFIDFKKIGIEKQTMVSIEPIMDFDLPTFLLWLGILRPNFVSVGANTGKTKLNEPSSIKLIQFLWRLELETQIKRKKNLNRLLQKEGETVA